MDVIDNGYSDKKDIDFLKQRLAELEKKEYKSMIGFIDYIIREREADGRSTRHFAELIKELEKWKGDIHINDTTYQ